jgi:hypothetical protein
LSLVLGCEKVPDRPLTDHDSNRAETPEALTEAQVIERLGQRREDVPGLRQVRRWRPLFRPLPVGSEGRPGRPPIRYPPEAVDTLEAIMEIRAGRKLPEHVVGFELWWRGVDVDLQVVRSYIGRLLDEDTAVLLSTPDPHDLADTVERLLETKRSHGALPALLLERLGGDLGALISATYAITLLLRGVTPVLDTTSAIVEADDEPEMDPKSAILRVTGLSRAMTDNVPGTDETLLDDDLDLSAFFDELGAVELFAGRLSDPVHAATDEELETARIDASIFSTHFRELASAAETAFGGDFAGWAIFTLDRREQEERFYRAGIVLMMLILRKKYGEGIDLINQTLQERMSEARTYNTIVERFPEYADYLRSDQAERLAALSPEQRERMVSDISNVLNEHTP